MALEAVGQVAVGHEVRVALAFFPRVKETREGSAGNRYDISRVAPVAASRS